MFDSKCKNYITRNEAAFGGSGNAGVEPLHDTGEVAMGGTGSKDPANPNEVEHQRRQACSFVVSHKQGEPIWARSVELSADRSTVYITPLQGAAQALGREKVILVRLDC